MTAPEPAAASSRRASLRQRLRRPGWRILGLLILASALWTTPYWARALLAKLDFFRLRQVEVRGTHYLPPEEVVERMRVDTLMSVWDELRPVSRRVIARTCSPAIPASMCAR